MIRSNPPEKKRQQKTANCVICLSALIPPRFFGDRKYGGKPLIKISDSDNLLVGHKG